jgi:hypothetical protein
MKATMTTMAILAIAAVVGAVGGLASVSFLQQAEASSCQIFIDESGNLIKEKCSSDRSFERAHAHNVKIH